MFEFLTTLFACTLSILVAVCILKAIRSGRKKNWLPDGAYKIRSTGNGWQTFSLRINFEEHRFLSNGDIIVEIKQD